MAALRTSQSLLDFNLCLLSVFCPDLMQELMLISFKLAIETLRLTLYGKRLTRNEVQMAKTKTVVHFVHGTWPYGPFRKTAPSNSLSWFEDGSLFRERISKHVNNNTVFDTFMWSGRNSFKARENAVVEFSNYFKESKRKYPRARHVVVAHSHGGTVCTDYLKYHIEHDISAIVCLSTPFAYMVKRHSWEDDHATLFCVAVASLFLAICFYCSGFYILNHFSAWLYFPLWVIANVTVSGVLLSFTERYESRLNPFHLRSPPPIFVIRATRDEAALVTGLAQTLGHVGRVIFETYDGSGNSRLLRYALICFFLFGGWVIFGVLFQNLSHNMTTFEILLSSTIFGAAFSAILFLLSYAIVAISTGQWNLRLWFHHTIEVDAVPMETPVIFKSYAYLDGFKTKSLRHGIYDEPEVQEDIIGIIRAINANKKPKLLPIGESVLDHLFETL